MLGTRSQTSRVRSERGGAGIVIHYRITRPSKEASFVTCHDNAERAVPLGLNSSDADLDKAVM